MLIGNERQKLHKKTILYNSHINMPYIIFVMCKFNENSFDKNHFLMLQYVIFVTTLF